MDELWNRIEAVFSRQYPQLLELWNPGATAQQIDHLEQVLGVKLPEDFKEFYKLKNGASDGAGLIREGEFLSLSRIEDEWQVWKDLLGSGDFEGSESQPVRGIKSNWWNAKWIPFTYDGSGNHLCIDLDPDSDGHSGQIITMWHDSADRELEALNFKTWLEEYVFSLEDGSVVYSEDHAGFVPVEDADEYERLGLK